MATETQSAQTRHNEKQEPIMSTKDKPDDKKALDMYKSGLDDLVNVNSLFTVAVFVGLSFATPGLRSLENRLECDADYTQSKMLVVFEVITFSLFLLSSLVAKSLKFNLQVNERESIHNDGQLTNSKWGLILLSVLASFLGCGFLMLSMIHVIQIRLGKLSCRSPYVLVATVSTIIIISLAMLIYFYMVIIDGLLKVRKP